MKNAWERLIQFWKRLFRCKNLGKASYITLQPVEIEQKEEASGPLSKQAVTGDTAVSEQKAALPGFAEQAKRFCGLYEALYTAHGREDAARCQEVLTEWRIRLSSLEGKPYAQAILQQIDLAEHEHAFQECAGWLLDCIFAAGVVRDDRKNLEMNALDILRYGAVDGRTLTPGEQACVLLPCWYDKQYLLERGMVS